jgi:peptidoglycan/xylan/chitin deacetylase (PgdA/CDA1 family)
MSARTLRWLLSLAHRPAITARGGGEARLTIIRHHRIYADGERPLYRLGVSESVFEAQLDLLVRHHRVPITVAEGLRRLEEGRPGHWVAMTFDDGYADNVWRALPRLQAVSGRATFYLTAGLMEERRAPWWDALAHALERTREPRLAWNAGGTRLDLPLGTAEERRRAMQALLPLMRVPTRERDAREHEVCERLGVHDAPCELATWDLAQALARAGMEIGAHTLAHPALSLLDPDQQRREIEGSVEHIERRVGVRPRGLAYPGGDYDRTTANIVAAAGLEHAVTTRAGDNGPRASAFELKRRGLSEGACLGPGGRFSGRLALAELDGAFDRLRQVEAAS